MTIEGKIKRLKAGGFILWSFCSDDEKRILKQLGPLILHYGGVTTAKLKK